MSTCLHLAPSADLMNRYKSIAGVKSDLTGLEETSVSSTGESGVNMSSSGPISPADKQIHKNASFV